MGFTALLCFMVTTLTPSCNTQDQKREGRYECGPHGTFQYCVEEDPGCVVGCHCHPGYYFDTETKICELNAKLIQHSRRYLAEPIGAYDLPATAPTPTTPFPSPTATTYPNKKDYEIQKDTDELGDWLYNQFFKTIENQVINNTNIIKSNGNVKPLTRRSAPGGPAVKKKRKIARKSVRSRRKRKHKKGRGLKKKLLRITEDDSLFDSDSGSDYSDSSDSSDSSYSDSNDYSNSDEKTSSDPDDFDDKDHGHKKVIIFNRRPKPPLPSFIFVPNMDTPYYPPIGLPPPPLLPMYPMPMAPSPLIPLPPPPLMVPLPPTVPPGSSQPPGPAENNNNDTTTTTTTTTTTPSTTTDDTNGRRGRVEKSHKRSNLDSKPGKPKNLKLGSKIRMMQKLMEKLKIKRRNNSSPSDTKSIDEFQDQDNQNTDDILNSLEVYTPHKRSPKYKKEDHIPVIEDVDFKYVSELIHRVHKSNATRSPLPFDLNRDLKELQLPQPSRRHFGPDQLYPQVHRQSSDDIYYSNLGRQMASLVRNADSEGYPQFNKNIEHANQGIPFHPVLNENNPRSFWERSVRSLPPQHGQVSQYLDESRTLKHSNEKYLINLENEVELVASTTPPLSLQEIENILNTIKKAHAHIKRHPTTSVKQSNVSLNINLLPKHSKPASSHERIYYALEKVEYQTQLPRVYFETKPAVVANNTNLFYEPEKNNNVPYSDNLMYNLDVNPMQPKSRPITMFAQTRKLIMPDNQTYNTNPTRQTSIDIVEPKTTEANIPRRQYIQFLNNEPSVKDTIPKSYEPKVKYKSLNYFSGNKHYMYETASYPLLSPFKSQVSKRINKPSYFHRHLHHFEYFD